MVKAVSELLAAPTNLPIVLLATCNRVEVYYDPDVLDMRKKLRMRLPAFLTDILQAYEGNDCFLHLCRVALGLESAQVGETEITHQVRRAYSQACACGSLSPDMHYAFQKALKIVKEVRTLFPIGTASLSLAQAIWKAARVAGLNPVVHRTLFVGASEINGRCMAYWKAKKAPFTLCNRSSRDSPHFLPFLELKRWTHFDFVIVATKAPYPLLWKQDVHDRAPRLVVDLAVPRNADPALATIPGLTLLNIDDVNHAIAQGQETQQMGVSAWHSALNEKAVRQLSMWRLRKEKLTLLSSFSA